MPTDCQDRGYRGCEYVKKERLWFSKRVINFAIPMWPFSIFILDDWDCLYYLVYEVVYLLSVSFLMLAEFLALYRRASQESKVIVLCFFCRFRFLGVGGGNLIFYGRKMKIEINRRWMNKRRELEIYFQEKNMALKEIHKMNTYLRR